MPRPRKLVFHNTVLFVTASVEEGLLLPANAVVKTLLKSALARAQTLHPVVVCHLVVEATHVHLMLVVDDPDDVKGFMERFKTESAHSINRLLGRRKRTVWCEGYDSPLLLTLEDAVEKIIYLYTNPAKDGLEESIVKYPGLSSWKMFTKRRFINDWYWIFRSAVPRLEQKLTAKGYQQLAGELAGKGVPQKFRVEPDAWMRCYGITDPDEQGKLNREIVERVFAREKLYSQERASAGRGVLGRKRLESAALNTDYQPERYGKRMWCICCDRVLRKEFIEHIKELIGRAREVYQRWRQGYVSEPFPLGLYAPAAPKLAEPLGLW